MRREWTAWIKQRDWKELERLAKSDPSQPLADTVAELERGFPDKADRKALRKVLFLLAQQGFKPQPIEESEPETESTNPAAPREFAFMLSADARGTESVTYGYEKDGRFLILYADLNTREGIIRADETDVSIDQGEKYAEKARNASGTVGIDAEVPPDFALGRLSQGLSQTRGALPSVIAYWRSKIDRYANLPHPADSFPRNESTAEERKRALCTRDTTLEWRLESDFFAAALDTLFVERDQGGWSDADTLAKARETLHKEKKSFFTDEAIADHAQRLLDLAYLLHLRNNPDAGILLWTADDLRSRRHESEYGGLLLERAVELVERTLSGRPRMVRMDQ